MEGVEERVKHPGKTKAQQRVLDEIGCGNHSPIAAKATIKALLDQGLIVELSELSVPVFGGLRMKVRQFDMPLHVHMEWCLSCSESFKEPHP